ncbi:MAG: hypothetical protein Q9218_000347 [Villophora microphyllina]
MSCLPYRTVTFQLLLGAPSLTTTSRVAFTARNVTTAPSTAFDDLYLPFDQFHKPDKDLASGQLENQQNHHVKNLKVNQAGGVFNPTQTEPTLSLNGWADARSDHDERVNVQNPRAGSNRDPPSLLTTHLVPERQDLGALPFRVPKSSSLRREPRASRKIGLDGRAIRSTIKDAQGDNVRDKKSGPSGARNILNRVSTRASRQETLPAKREDWQIQKDVLATKFGTAGWSPRKRLSPDALEGIRALHAQFPEKYSTPVLANHFEVSPEAIRRILKSKWRPNENEVIDRRQRWDNRGERIWTQMVALGVKPPKKWREMFCANASVLLDGCRSSRVAFESQRIKVNLPSNVSLQVLRDDKGPHDIKPEDKLQRTLVYCMGEEALPNANIFVSCFKSKLCQCPSYIALPLAPRTGLIVTFSTWMSNIRVSVSWENPAVFAGEDVKCVVTFRNIAQVPSSTPVATQTQTRGSSHECFKDIPHAHLQHQNSHRFPLQSCNGSRLEGHRNSPPVTSPRTAKSPATNSDEAKGDGSQIQPERETTHRQHKRSVSIVSVSGDATSSERPPLNVSAWGRSGRGHGRAASLQVLPERYTASNKGLSFSDGLAGSSIPIFGRNPATTHHRTPTSPPLWNLSSISTDPSSNPVSSYNVPHGIPGSGSRSWRPHSREPSLNTRESPAVPKISASDSKAPQLTGDASTNDSYGKPAPTRVSAQVQSDPVLNSLDRQANITSTTSNEATPRSSIDVYSGSNGSSDTLASEYVHRDHSRFSQQPLHAQQTSCYASSRTREVPETLMMGYVNMIGCFHLDTSLIDASPFDEVKSMGVVGNQGGGGVVRPGAAKHRSGLLGSFGWNTLGESLGGLLGSSEVSSIKETMRATTAKWIPIISTSQSLLFVDLRLEPGQKKSYSYTYRLPAGIPPSYRGKVIRISYNVVIGVQTAARSAQRHTVRQHEFPFRVFPGVNGMAWGKID